MIGSLLLPIWGAPNHVDEGLVVTYLRWCVALLSPVGICLGTVLPLSMHLLDRSRPGALAHAWGTTGLASVIASVLGTSLAGQLGFTVVTVLAALCYGTAALLAARSRTFQSNTLWTRPMRCGRIASAPRHGMPLGCEPGTKRGIRHLVDERERRIVEKAVELAERGGFEGVRQRDVAAQSGVALGTLYKRFKGKDELLVAALNMEMEKLDNRLKRRPVPGDSPLERVENFFEAATQVFVKRPNLGRASIRAVASGEPDIARRLHAYHERIGRGIITALLGSEPPRALTELQMTEAELANLAYMLQQMWFSVLVGWSGGLVEPEVAVSRVAETADLLVRGMQAKKSQDLPQ